MGDLRKAAEMAIKCYAARENIKLSKAMQTLELALAQPEQKPVAWMNIEDNIFYKYEFKSCAESDKNAVPLYTVPKREWVGLDKSDMNVLRSVAEFTSDAEGFIRLVEEKLKEKNT